MTLYVNKLNDWYNGWSHLGTLLVPADQEGEFYGETMVYDGTGSGRLSTSTRTHCSQNGSRVKIVRVQDRYTEVYVETKRLEPLQENEGL